MLAPLLLALNVAQIAGVREGQPPEQAPRPLTLAAVKVGDFVRYDLGNGTLELRACARQGERVTVAVSVKPNDAKPRPPSLLEGALLELSQKPLQPPVMLDGGREAPSVEGPGFALHDCEQWDAMRTTHSSSRMLRCTGREVILGGGFVSTEETYLGPAGHWQWRRALSAAGNDPAPCPAWPRARVDGWERVQEQERGKSSVSERSYTGGSVWVRVATRAPHGKAATHDETLAELLVDSAARYLATTGEAKREKLHLGKRGLDVGTVGDEGGSQSWPDAASMGDAPLAARIAPVSEQRGELGSKLLDWGAPRDRTR